MPLIADASSATWPQRLIPAIGWIRRYQRPWLGRDLMAGIVTACVVVPQCIAYASLAGLPVEVGLYIATVPMLLYALLGTSRPLSVSTTSTISLLTAATIERSGQTEPREAAAATALIVGVALLGVGLFRLGFLADLVSSPILTGFKTGTGLVIISGQLGKLMGVPVGGSGFFSNLRDAIDGLDDIHRLTLALGIGTIALLVVLRTAAPRVPAPLLAVVLGIASVAIFNLADHGVAVIGEVPAGLPRFALPSPDEWGMLVPGALGVALMCAVESLAAGRALAARDDAPVDANRELIALGTANLGAGVFQAYPAGGGLSQSAVNDQAGAKTQMAEVVTVGVVVLVLTLLTGLLEDLANATLAALVIVAASGLIQPAAFRRLARIRTRDFVLALVALGGVLTFGILDGVLIAIAASIITLAYQANHRAVEVLGLQRTTGRFRTLARHPDAEPIAGLVIVRPRGPVTFANVHRVRAEVIAAVERTEPTPRVIVWEMEAVTDLEITALEELAKLTSDLRQRRCNSWIASATTDQLDMLTRYELAPSVRIFDTLDEAVSAFLATEAPP